MFIFILTLLILSIASCVSLGALSARAENRKHVVWFLALMVLFTFWSFCGAMILAVPDFETRVLFTKLKFLAIPFVIPVSFVLLSWVFTGPRFIFTRAFKILLFFVPALIAIATVSPWFDPWVLHSFVPETSLGFEVVRFKEGPLFKIYVYLGYFWLVWIFGLLIYEVVVAKSLQKKRALLLLFGCFFSTIVDVVGQQFGILTRWYQIPPALFIVNAVVVYFAVFRYRLFNFETIAKDRIFERTPAALWVFDADRRLLAFNHLASQISHLDSSMIGLGDNECFRDSPEILSVLLKKSDQSLELKGPQTEASRYYDFTSDVVVDEKLGESYHVILAFDATVRARLEKEILKQNSELQALNDRAKTANDFRNRLLMLLAHDVVGNFRGIEWALESVKVSPSESQWSTLIETVVTTREVLRNMVLWARAQGDEYRRVFTAFDVRLVIRDLLGEISVFADAQKIKLKYLPASAPVIIDGDSELMTAVVRNLLSNAIKSSDAGSTVEIVVSLNQTELKISVYDDGPGFNLLQPSLSSGEEAKTSNDGFGVGLSLVRELISLVNGRLEVVGKEPRGSEFRLVVPLR